MPESLGEAVPMEMSTSCFSNIWPQFPYQQWSEQNRHMPKEHRFNV